MPAAVYTVDSCGRIVLFNKAAIELWGREPEIGKELWCGSSEIYHADGTPVSKDRSPIAISVREGRSVRGEEVILKRMDGEFRNIVPHSSPIIDANGKITGGINVMLDITKRKRAEEELKNAFEKLSRSENEIRLFAKQLNNVLEDERSRIAREIHDEFGQQLVGLKMLLSSLDKIIGFDAGAKYIVDEMMRGLDSTSLSLQNFSTELRPGILDTLGLIPSIEWLAKEFEHKAGIACDLEIRTADQMFEKTLSNAYFRICQEALTNVVKHAEASRVTIQVIQDQNQLSLAITDNGKGIVNEKLENPFSMGLLGMRERANLIGAQLHVESSEHKGTRVEINGKINGVGEAVGCSAE